MTDIHKYVATCSFGQEGVIARELKKLGAQNVNALDARVVFEGKFDVLADANICLRSADRVFFQIMSFPAVTFEQLFDGVCVYRWPDILPKNAKFTVKGKSAKSTLFSVSDCQSIVKKAIAKSLGKGYRLQWLPETGNEYIIEVALLNDIATISLDASGTGLNRRGYRIHNSPAPLRESVAGGLVQLSNWDAKKPFADPLCGSGTLAIEAALIGINRAPGIMRSFAMEQWEFLQKDLIAQRKTAARSLERDSLFEIWASDKDKKVLELAKNHAARAGVEQYIRFSHCDAKDIDFKTGNGIIVTNPPYGERMGDSNTAHELYKTLGVTFRALDEWNCYILTADSQFERYYGKRATKKRKVYNGGMMCTYYMYY